MAEGAAVASLGIQVAGQIKAANAARDAAEARSAAKRLQATELLRRSEFNIERLTSEVKAFKQTQLGAFAKGGVDIGSGAPLVLLEQTQRELVENVLAQREEAQFKAQALQSGADIDLALAGDIATARNFQTASTLFKGFSLV